MPRLALFVIVVAACHSTATQHDYPKLADGDAPDRKAEAPHHPDAGTTPGHVATPQLYEPGGAPCMPPGVYDVVFELADAKLTIVGQADEFCRSMLMAVPQQNLNQMKIEIENGTLAVYWPAKQVVESVSQCEFVIKSQPVLAAIKFEGGAGSGTGAYGVGSSNHPGEKCEAKGAKLTLVRASS